MNGLDHLVRLDSFPRSGSRVGLLCHHASCTRDHHHLVDIANASSEWDVQCIFTPEHGFTGKAAPGERIDHSIHSSLEVPIYSLYGETRSPKPEWLSTIDLLVIDLKDLGVRCYTYASTLFLMLSACAEQGIPVLILDRPTPLHGITDGPDLEEGHESFVGLIPLPVVYGYSQGELAVYLKETLPELRRLSLEVIAFTGEEENDPWIPPSPAITSVQSALCYPVTVWSEAIPNVWVDRGGPDSFQVWAMPDFPDIDMQNYQLFGYHIEEKDVKTPRGLWRGLHFTGQREEPCKPICLAHHLFKDIVSQHGHNRLFEGDGARPEFFDQLAGTSGWRKSLIQGTDPLFFSIYVDKTALIASTSSFMRKGL